MQRTRGQTVGCGSGGVALVDQARLGGGGGGGGVVG